MTWTVEHVALAAERFATGLATADPAAEVPACPGWTVTDLVAHLGNVHTWVAAIVASGGPVEEPVQRPGGVPLDQWYAARASHLLQVLADSDPDAPCWNFARVDEVAGFWRRRQLHEVLMHLVDLDQAHGRGTDLEPATCADGVSETFEVFGPRLHARGVRVDLAAPVSLVASDTGDVWTLHPVDDGPPSVSRGAPVADRVDGTAAQLWQRLWKRGDDVTVSGDADLVAGFLGSRLSA